MPGGEGLSEVHVAGWLPGTEAPAEQERKQATSPRGLMAWLVFDCGRAVLLSGRYAFRRRK